MERVKRKRAKARKRESAPRVKAEIFTVPTFSYATSRLSSFLRDFKVKRPSGPGRVPGDLFTLNIAGMGPRGVRGALVISRVSERRESARPLALARRKNQTTRRSRIFLPFERPLSLASLPPFLNFPLLPPRVAANSFAISIESIRLRLRREKRVEEVFTRDSLSRRERFRSFIWGARRPYESSAATSRGILRDPKGS